MKHAPVGRFFNSREFKIVDDGQLRGARQLCRLFLDPLRAEFGRCTVISGRRTEAKNRAVGGAPASRHLYDQFPTQPAADVVFATGTPAAWHRKAKQLQQAHGIGGVGRYDTHLHVDIGPKRSW